MLRGIDAKETIEFISTDDTAENPTVFLLGNISNRDKLNLFADAINSAGVVDMNKISSRIFDIAKAGLRGIKNLGGKNYTAIDEATLEAIPFNVVIELVNKLVEINFLGAKQEKN